MCGAVVEWFVFRGLVDTPWLDLFILMSAVRGPGQGLRKGRVGVLGALWQGVCAEVHCPSALKWAGDLDRLVEHDLQQPEAL